MTQDEKHEIALSYLKEKQSDAQKSRLTPQTEMQISALGYVVSLLQVDENDITSDLKTISSLT